MKRSQKFAIFCFAVAIIVWIIIAIGDAKYGYPQQLPVISDKIMHGMDNMLRLGDSMQSCTFVFENYKKFGDHVTECEHFMKDVGTLIDKLYQKYPDM
jgi:hypothetical protein